MAHLVDSSVWVALFLDFDAQHRKAERIIRNLDSQIYASYGVIAEVATVLAYKQSKASANHFISYLRDNRDFAIINDDALEEMNFYASIADKISFVDAALIFLSRKLGAELITFDKQLERIARKNKRQSS